MKGGIAINRTLPSRLPIFKFAFAALMRKGVELGEPKIGSNVKWNRKSSDRTFGSLR